jgi:hypothetical protein
MQLRSWVWGQTVLDRITIDVPTLPKPIVVGRSMCCRVNQLVHMIASLFKSCDIIYIY